MGASGDNPMMQQTILLSNNTSYPAFSSDVDMNSIGMRQGVGQRNLTIGGGPHTAGSTNKQSTTQVGGGG